MGNDNLDPTAVQRQLADDARRRAAADPLPGPMAQVFLENSITIGSHTIRRIVLSDWAILRGLKSPIIAQMLELQKPLETREEVPYSDEDGWEMIWQFSHTPSENRALLAKGRDAYREQAITEIGDKIEVGQGALIVEAVQRQIMASFATAQKHGTEEEAEKKSPPT